MPTMEQILLAVAGKGVERGLEPEREGEVCILRYAKPTDEREDNLHKQSIRSLVMRIAPDWKIHIPSREDGFGIEVRPKPNVMPKPAAEGAGVIPRIPDTSDTEKISQIVDQLQGIAKELQALAS